MSASSCDPRSRPDCKRSYAGHSQSPVPAPSGTSTTSPSALVERIEARRLDPEFQKRLKQNLERHQKVLELLAYS